MGAISSCAHGHLQRKSLHSRAPARYHHSRTRGIGDSPRASRFSVHVAQERKKLVNRIKQPSAPALGITACVMFCAASTAQASFHLWGINEVYSNSSGTIQFVEMRNDAGSFENFTQGQQFKSNANTLTLNHNLNGDTLNKTFLMATPGYAALSGVPTPDFVFPTNNFFNINGDTLTFQFAQGDGLHPATFTFTGAQLPTDGTRSLNYDRTINAVNSPTNYAGQSGSVPEPALLGLCAFAAVVSLFRTRR